MLEWYTPETGKIVEENWAIERSILEGEEYEYRLKRVCISNA